MSQLIMRRWSLVLSISLILVWLLTACTTTPPNTNETTPPTLAWTVRDATNGTTQTYAGSSNPTIHTTQGTQYFVTFRANDPGGIKQIILGYGTGWSCSHSDGSVSSGSSLGIQQVQNFSPDSNGNVSTSEFFVDQVKPTFVCSENSNFTSGEVDFLGTSTNYSNKQAQSTLAFVVP